MSMMGVLYFMDTVNQESCLSDLCVTRLYLDYRPNK